MPRKRNISLDLAITEFEDCDSFRSTYQDERNFDVCCKLIHVRNCRDVKVGDDEDQSHSLYPSSSIQDSSDSICSQKFGQLIVFRSKNSNNNETWTVSKESTSSFHFSVEDSSNRSSLILTIKLKQSHNLSDEGGKEDCDCDYMPIDGSIPIIVDKMERDSVQWINLISTEQEDCIIGRVAVAISIQSENSDAFFNNGYDKRSQKCLDLPDESVQTCSASIGSRYVREEDVNMHFDEPFCLTIKLQGVSNIVIQEHHSQMVQCHWISYEFLGNIVQSEKFNPTLLSSFVCKEDVFELKFASYNELQSFLKYNTINIHVCKEGMVVGRAEVNLFTALGRYREGSTIGDNYKSFAEGWIVIHCGKINDYELPKSSTELSTEEILQNLPQINMSLSLSKGLLKANLAAEEASNDINTHRNDGVYDVDLSIVRQAELLQKAKNIAQAEIDLDKKRRKEFREKEEMKFKQHLRKKEEAVRRHLEEQMKLHESQQIKAIQSCRNEYKILESRLKSALSEVEAKEREMERILAANNTTFVQKVTELDLKEKLIREESQHIVDMEKAKSQAMMERIKVAESAAEAAKNRALKAEESMRNSNETKMAQELNMLKCQVEEMKNKIKSQESQRNEIILQRDQYRKAAHKLARMVRQEKERNKNNEGTREIDELYRIQKELRSLTTAEEKL